MYFETQIIVAAAPDKVFAALTVPEQLLKWDPWLESFSYSTGEAKMGANYKAVYREYALNTDEEMHQDEMEDIVREGRIGRFKKDCEFSWIEPMDGVDNELITRLEACEKGTKVTVSTDILIDNAFFKWMFKFFPFIVTAKIKTRLKALKSYFN